MHLGLTSYDTEDPATALRMVEAAEILAEDLRLLEAAIAARALEHKDTLMMGRTHGMHAEPITFGLKLLNWLDEVRRDQVAPRSREAGHRRRQAQRAGRQPRHRAAGARGARLRAPRPRRRRRQHAGRLARPPRPLHADAGADRRLAGALRDRGAPPAAQRGRRGGGAVPARPAGLQLDAAQAQPGEVRARLRPGPRPARQLASPRWRTWRSGTSATSASRPSSA